MSYEEVSDCSLWWLHQVISMPQIPDQVQNVQTSQTDEGTCHLARGKTVQRVAGTYSHMCSIVVTSELQCQQ